MKKYKIIINSTQTRYEMTLEEAEIFAKKNNLYPVMVADNGYSYSKSWVCTWDELKKEYNRYKNWYKYLRLTKNKEFSDSFRTDS